MTRSQRSGGIYTPPVPRLALGAAPPDPSLRDLAYGLFAADAPFLAGLADGLASLRGSDAQPQPLGDESDCPWAYLDLMDEVAAPQVYLVDGVIRLWVYDYPHAGYVRIHRLLQRALQVVSDFIDAVDATPAVAYWTVEDTGEVVFDLQPGQVSGPSEDTGLGRLQRWASFPYSKANQGVSA
jgi:hypothetical protein